MRGWGRACPSVRLPDLTKDSKFRPHTIILRKEIKKGVVDRGRSVKSAEKIT
jgi:hypothetical protein